jgi:MFS family permease
MDATSAGGLQRSVVTWAGGNELELIVVSLLVKPVSRRLDRPYLAAFGLCLIAAGNLTLVLSHTTWWGIGAGVHGAGLGIGFSSVAGTGISDTLAGSATGIVNTGAQMGTALGTAGLILVASFDGFGPLAGPALAWAIAAAGAAAMAPVISLQRRHEGNREVINLGRWPNPHRACWA